jgi:8-oxo-dGTP pyrophosphatase MutT (NUDIX family)
MRCARRWAWTRWMTEMRAPTDRVISDGSDPVGRLRQAIERHPAGDQREAESCGRCLVELDRLPRPFDRHADLTHVTASGIVVGPRGVVLHNHRRLRRWLQPGGHLDPGESPSQAVIRECTEETGLAVSHPPDGPLLIHVDVHTAAEDHVHLDIRYLVLAPDEDPAPPPGESQEVAWFSWDDAADLADVALSGALRSARRVMPTSAGDDERKDEP